MTDFVLPLDSPAATLEVAGGKGANLASLIRAGFPVPPGFIITTHAYRAFIEANNLGPRILELSRQAPADDPAALERASQAIRQLFEKATIPEAITEAILEAYRELASDRRPPTAIRSSAPHPLTVHPLIRYAAGHPLLFALLPQPRICPRPVSPASRTRI